MKSIIPYFLFFIFIFCFSTSNSKAQETNFSQFYSNKLYLNPAYGAAITGGSLYAHYRQQWFKIPGTYSKYNLGAHTPIKEFGAFIIGGGLTLDGEVEGEGLLKRYSTGAVIAFASNNHTGKTYSNFSFGIRPNYNILAIDWDKLVFGDQIDAVLGAIFPTDAILPTELNPNYLNFDIGGMFQAYSEDAYDFNVGVNIKNINLQSSAVSFYEQIIREKLQLLSLHSSMTFQISNTPYVFLSPDFKWDLYFQSQLSAFTGGFNVSIVSGTKAGNRIPEYYTTLFGGLYYHQRPFFFGNQLDKTGAVVMNVGFKSKPQNAKTAYQLIASYEFTGGSLQNTQSGGSFECSLKLHFEDDFFGGGKGRNSKQKSKFDCVEM